MYNQDIQVVLVGQIRSGKTSLYNRITNSNEVTGYGGKSITISVFSKYAAYGNMPFKVLDTPGFGCYDKKIYHYAGIIAALTEAPVKRILLVVNLDRIENIWKFVLPILAPLHRFKHLISIVITHWDLCENKDRDRQLIEQLFGEKNIKSFIYTSKDEDPQIICENIINEFQKSQPEVIKFMESELVTQFDLIEFKDELEFEVELIKEQIQKKFKKKAYKIRQYIENTQPPAQQIIYRELLAEGSLMLLNNTFFNKTLHLTQSEQEFCKILHTLTIESKKIAETCINKLEKKNQNIINLMLEKNGSYYGFLLNVLLKKELSSYLDDIAQLAQQKFFAIKGHCFNHIRKCNYCGQIWMKVQGCEGKTFCGAIPNQDELINGNKTNISQDKWKIGRKSQMQDDKKELYEIGEIGCGKLIQWSKMELLSKGELRELIDPGMLDFLCLWDEEITQKAKQQEFLDILYQQIALQRQQIQHQ